MVAQIIGAVVAVVFSTGVAQADTPVFQNISQSDLENIVEDFSAVFHYSPVSGASSLGKLFGLEFGAVASLTETPGVESLVHEADPNTDVKALPAAGFFAALSVPFGVTVEASYFPENELEDVDLEHMSIGVRWTMTDTVLELPVDLALRGSITESKLGFTQEVGGTPAAVTLENSILAAGVVVSKSLVIVEPYFGVSYVKSDGEMKISGNNTFFDFGGQSASKDVSGTHVYAGVNANLLLLNLGIEAGKVFDSTRYSAKISFKF